jgi:transposase-like protein
VSYGKARAENNPSVYAAFQGNAVRLSSLPIVTKGVKLDKEVAAELKELRKLKKEHERLKMEHDLLKEAIAFTSARRAKSSPSSTAVKARTRSE